MTIDRIGPYRVLAKIGEGGMGEVYRGLDPKLGRPVAIKVIGPSLRSDSRAVERLTREGRNASSLNHPNIVTIYDVGEHSVSEGGVSEGGGAPYIVMEFIEGRSLWMRMAEGPIRTREALELASQVAEGLAAAHAADIVHRDLKPQNIMITPDGRAKIVDFGVSKAAPTSHGNGDGREDAAVDTRTLTAYDAIVGTVGYMSPEQVTSRHVDGRSDQFALGAILYEMLTRKRAFDRGTAVQTMASIIEDEPEPLIDLCPQLPLSVITIVERCLAKDPENRYASTRDLARDLRDALTEVLTNTRSSSAEHRALRPRRSWMTLAAGVLATLTLIGAVPVQQTRRAATAPVVDTGGPRPIVVLPIANITKDPADQIFCDGLVETLTSSLTQLERFHKSLRVIAATEVRREKATSAKEARLTLGAALVITGSLQRDATATRLTLNLVDAANLGQLSSQTITMPPGQSSPTQEMIVTAATRLLDLPLDTDRALLTAGGSVAPGAYGNFVRGRGYLQRFDKVENVDLAIESFDRALRADPKYALARAALGEAYWRKYELSRDASLIDRAEESCREALKIDGNVAPIHVTLAIIKRGRGRYEEAAASAQRALQIDPVNSDAFRELGRAYESMNHPADAEATYLKAATARPDDWLVQNALGSFYLAHNKLSEAEASFKRMLQLTPDNTRAFNNLGATYFMQKRTEEAAATWEQSMLIRATPAASSNLGAYYYDQSRYADSARNFQKAVDLSPNDYRLWENLAAAQYWTKDDRPRALEAYARSVTLALEARQVNPRQPEILVSLADAYSLLGRKREAGAVAVELERLNPTDPAVMFSLASAYEQMGNRVRALDWLGKAMAAGYSRERIDRSPFLDQLRKDERYSGLVH